MAGIAGRVYSRAIRILYPQRCPICTSVLPGGRLICPSCEKQLPLIREPFCRKCGRAMKDIRQEYCEECQLHAHIFDRGQCCFSYEKQMRISLMRMKFENHREYIPFYACSMYASGKGFLARCGAEQLIPIPCSPRRVKERGFDQCFLLTRELSRLSGIPQEKDNLIRVKATSPQKGLDRHSRAENVKNAFAVKRPENLAKKVVLVDDIYTTGATMDEAARCLKEAGVEEVCFLCLCSARIN